MPPIFFNVKLVRDLLMSQGKVATLRKTLRSCETDAVQGNYWKRKKLARVVIEPVSEVAINFEEDYDIIREYLPLSGFKRLTTWMRTAKILSGDKLYLHLVQVKYKYFPMLWLWSLMEEIKWRSHDLILMGYSKKGYHLSCEDRNWKALIYPHHREAPSELELKALWYSWKIKGIPVLEL